jgi:hypothetical protein
MNSYNDPIVSEFETPAQAESYDRWFRAKVQASLSDGEPTTPHAQVMKEMDIIIARAEARHAALA